MTLACVCVYVSAALLVKTDLIIAVVVVRACCVIIIINCVYQINTGLYCGITSLLRAYDIVITTTYYGHIRRVYVF